MINLVDRRSCSPAGPAFIFVFWSSMTANGLLPNQPAQRDDSLDLEPHTPAARGAAVVQPVRRPARRHLRHRDRVRRHLPDHRGRDRLRLRGQRQHRRPGASASTSDTFWPRAVAAMLVAARPARVLSVQMVAPTRRWRIRRHRPKAPPAPPCSRRSPDGAAAARPARRGAVSAAATPAIVPADPATLGVALDPALLTLRAGLVAHRRRLWLRRSVRRAWYVLAGVAVVEIALGDRDARRPARVGAPSSPPPSRSSGSWRCWCSSSAPVRRSARRPSPWTPKAGPATPWRRRSRSPQSMPGHRRPGPEDDDETIVVGEGYELGAAEARFVRRQRRDAVGRLRTIEPGLFRPRLARPARAGRAGRRRAAHPGRAAAQPAGRGDRAEPPGARGGAATGPAHRRRRQGPRRQGRRRQRPADAPVRGAAPARRAAAVEPGRPRHEPVPARLDRGPGPRPAGPRERAASGLAGVARAVAVARRDGRSAGEPRRRPREDQGRPQGPGRQARLDDPGASATPRRGISPSSRARRTRPTAPPGRRSATRWRA